MAVRPRHQPARRSGADRARARPGRRPAGPRRPLVRCGGRADRRARRPERVRGLALYEPTLFSRHRRRRAAAERCRRHPRRGGRCRRSARRRRPRPAPPSTSSTTGWDPEAGGGRRRSGSRRSPRRSSTCGAGSTRSFTEPTPLAAFRALDVPVLYMIGRPLDRIGARRRAAAVRALPRVERVEFETPGTWVRSPTPGGSTRRSPASWRACRHERPGSSNATAQNGARNPGIP